MDCIALSTGLGPRDAAKKLSHNVARRVMAHVVSWDPSTHTYRAGSYGPVRQACHLACIAGIDTHTSCFHFPLGLHCRHRYTHILFPFSTWFALQASIHTHPVSIFHLVCIAGIDTHRPMQWGFRRHLQPYSQRSLLSRRQLVTAHVERPVMPVSIEYLKPMRQQAVFHGTIIGQIHFTRVFVVLQAHLVA